ncbi:MMPL family transporter [Pseudofrankia inefficax]|uniref:MMPL family transporter n=1 Tax=Pseudofrankia inefficax (strain DSM 45817 / CECT 9037 / DDB 130130 / EuI1c) TaxID=298654 RepID=UPI000674CBB5|nr:MMPL family transporter [Pseudofrankia inefficax]
MLFGWLAVFVVGLVLAPTVSGRLRSGLALSSPGFTANENLARQFGGAGINPSVLLLTFPKGTTADAPGATAALRAVEATIPHDQGIRSVSYLTTHAPALLGAGHQSTVVLLYPADAQTDTVDTAVMDRLAHAATTALPGTRTDVTGVEQLAAGGGSGGTSVLVEVVIGAALALVILAWVFGSFLAVLPLLTGLVSIVTMLLAVLGLTYVFPGTRFNPSIEAIVAILGLGMSIDYALLVVTRWRESRAAGLDNDQAVRAATVRAGHAVLVSGLTASVGLVGLVVIPVSFVRGVAVAGLFIPSIAALVSVSLLPALLRAFGPALDRFRWRRRDGDRLWRGWARGVVRRRWAAAAVGAAVLILLAVMTTAINIALPSLRSLSSGGPARTGLTQLTADGFPDGTLTTLPVLVRPGLDPAAVGDRLATAKGVVGVLRPTDAQWRAADGTSVVFAMPARQIGEAGQGSVLAGIRAAAPSADAVGGNEILQHDNSHAVYHAFPYALILVAAITFLFLARALRSVVLPLKAVLLNLLSVAATYGCVVILWQWGHGLHALFGLNSSGAVNGLAPVLLFGFLFGLSMDYEVFILSRIQEAHDDGASTDEAVVEGLARTGRLVTCAALILFATLVALASASDPVVKIIASGLAIGVVLDATIVRSLLAPALVSLFDQANWWWPGWLDRTLGRPLTRTRPAARGASPVANVAQRAALPDDPVLARPSTGESGGAH